MCSWCAWVSLDTHIPTRGLEWGMSPLLLLLFVGYVSSSSLVCWVWSRCDVIAVVGDGWWVMGDGCWMYWLWWMLCSSIEVYYNTNILILSPSLLLFSVVSWGQTSLPKHSIHSCWYRMWLETQSCMYLLWAPTLPFSSSLFMSQ